MTFLFVSVLSTQLYLSTSEVNQLRDYDLSHVIPGANSKGTS